MRRTLVATTLLGLASLGAAIYPDGHFDVSHKMSVANFDDIVRKEVDAGKTLFQAPAWNAITQKFADNPDVAFGDVNLSEEQVRGNHNPGAGGWPTIRYFNKETGYGGGNYKKVTDGAMCDELGNQEHMQAYVEQYGKTSLCNIETYQGCSDKEKTYIEKRKSDNFDTLNTQYERLQGMTGNKMAPDLMKWLNQRIAIQKKFIAQSAEKSEL